MVRAIKDTQDVQDLFEQTTGLSEGTQVEECIVETIDPELDHNNRTGEDVLQCYVYLTPISAVSQGYIQDSDLKFENWTRQSYSIGNQLGIVYKWTSPIKVET